MANKDLDEKLNETPDEDMELNEEQLDDVAGGRWRMHPPTERERRRNEALKRQKQQQTEEPPELLDY